MSGGELSAVQAEAERARGEGLLRLGSDRASSILRGSEDLVGSLRTLGIVGFLLDADIDGFHQRMQLAARVRRRFFACVRAGMRCPAEHPLLQVGRAVEEALAGGDLALVAELAREQGGAAGAGVGARSKEGLVVAAVRSIVEGRDEDAKEVLARFEAVRGPEEEGLARLLGGIVRSDEVAFGEGLFAALADRHAASRGVDGVERWLAVDLIGFARLARRRGLEVRVADALIPAELLEAAAKDAGGAGALPPAPERIVDDLPKGSAPAALDTMSPTVTPQVAGASRKARPAPADAAAALAGGARLVLWDVAEQHLDEADFLCEQWERCLDAHNYTLAEVEAGPEDRLLAHVDGLLAGGAAVEARLLVPALDGDDPARVMAAAFTLLASGSARGLEATMRALASEDEAQRAGARRALELTARGGVEAPLFEAAGARAPAVQAAGLQALAFRGVDAGATLSGIRASDDAALVIAGLRAARVSQQRADHRLAAEARSSRVPAVRDEALATALVLGVPDTMAALRGLLVSGDVKTIGRAPLLLLATGGDARDLGALIDALAIPALRADALWALGFSGRAAAADACVPLIGDPAVGRLAGEALWAITGVPLEGPHLAKDRTPADEEAPSSAEGDVDAEVASSPEASIPALDPAAVSGWWSQQRSRFERQQRYLFGAPFAVESVLAALDRGPMRRRHALALEIAIRTRGRIQIETRAMSARQRAERERLAGLTAGDLERAYDGP